MSHASSDEYLVRSGYINDCQLKLAVAFQRNLGGQLVDVLVKLGCISASERVQLSRHPDVSWNCSSDPTAANEPMRIRWPSRSEETLAG
ncbi:MAG TPA: hypothetical protein VMK12_26705 [Anaeromyxobacteraceae bacterium]|nr:hypothetical protein [Anaeromyxobacteraceae bacterium]